MLDVIARSFRGRVCEYSNGETRVTTPVVVRSVEGDCDDPMYVSHGYRGRTFHVFGESVELDPSILTTASSDCVSTIRSEGRVSVVRLPFQESVELPETTEVVVVANAYELRKNPRALVDAVIRIRDAAGYNRLVVMLGLGEPSTLALLAYMGIDIFDDSLCAVMGVNGVRLIPEGELQADGDVSDENRQEIVRECLKASDFINGGRLRELVDQRSSSSPSSVAILRLFDRAGYEFQEASVNTAAGRFSCNTTQSLRRPDILRYRNMILERYRKPEHKKVLLLLPCSAKKPYHTSKTHKRFSSAIHVSNFDTAVHEVIVTSPLGIVPRELDSFYPANSYDIPVTGEWKCEEKRFIRELFQSLLAQGYEKVISHLGEDTELIEGLCEVTETVVGDSTSPVSLTNLENALRDATKGMEVGDYMIDRKETIRSVLSFQFGQEVADKVMDADTFGIGRYPYWKIMRGKVQLGMMTEERGGVSMTIDGAKVLAECGYNIVEMMDFDLKGNLFAIGVLKADPKIRIGDEAVVMKNGDVVAIGVAMMSGQEMVDLKRGIAVRIRHKSK